MTLSSNPRPTIGKDLDLRETKKPAWRTPVCRPVTLPAVTQGSPTPTADLAFAS